MKKIAVVVGAAAVLIPRASEAHIKWFCAYDTSIPPLPIKEVLTPTFFLVAAGFFTLMFLTYIIDQQINHYRWAAQLDAAIVQIKPKALTIIRVAVGTLFVALWATGGLILTPELKTDSTLIPWLQLSIAAGMLWSVTLLPAALGILGLYLYAIQDYGAFHLMDYPIFPAVAFYLGLSAAGDRFLQEFRLPVLYAGVAITMMWGAIEKFGYPCWTLPLLTEHPELTFGMDFDWFMNIAAFVEFSLAFFMLTGTALLRLCCFALLALLTTGIAAFGKIDAVGHLLIIACLIVMIIAGQNSLQLPAPVLRQRCIARAGTMTVGYGTVLSMFFGLYYGSQYLAGR